MLCFKKKNYLGKCVLNLNIVLSNAIISVDVVLKKSKQKSNETY